MSRIPVLTVIAGPNGSGKTILTRQLMRDGVDFGEYINPDDIAAGLDGSYDERVQEAQQEAERRRQACLSRRVDFSFETVMSHPSKLDVLRRARRRGYFVVLFFVATENPRLNVDRVAQRVALGGHDVPREKILERYERVLGLLPNAIRLADRTVLFDNSTGITTDLPVHFRPVLEITKRGRQLLYSVDGKSLRRLRWPPLPGWVTKSLGTPLQKAFNAGDFVLH